ncbi:nucleotide sugar dehydrogenase [Brevibacillus nitrificans]|uniref:nucleotide sugar dehydrogenase n=1 Tax=Brevibacillus nitrificans TaxID=651560 RepID=UPI00260B707A|nr:nucleotide sugar dehydrogenase [Brevibacillus nitrificans]
MGLGYVGLPLAVELAKAGYHVYGFEVDRSRVQQLHAADSYIVDVPTSELEQVIKSGKFEPTTNFSALLQVDVLSICVPSPLTKSDEPDLSYLLAATEQIKAYMHEGLLIILESTTYPGTTEELFEKELAALDYRVGKDYFLCYSPERIDPGNKQYTIRNIPKVIGGTTPACVKLGASFYQRIIEKIIEVSSPKVAEMSKLLENVFRTVNIAFINEMAMLCEEMGVDVWEAIEAAGSKPFGYMPFTPGPGIGGHCLPLDPLYLSWKAKSVNFTSKFIELAHEVNRSMPHYVCMKVCEVMSQMKGTIMGSRILLLGMAYKPDIDDVRESPSLDVYEQLREMGAHVFFHDPHVQSFLDKHGTVVFSIPLNLEELYSYDCVLVLTRHKVLPYQEIAKNARQIIDTRNAFKGVRQPHIYRLGTGSGSIEC